MVNKPVKLPTQANPAPPQKNSNQRNVGTKPVKQPSHANLAPTETRGASGKLLPQK